MVRGILVSLILWKLLFCNWMSFETLAVVHRNRDDNKLFHIKTNDWWQEVLGLFWVANRFQKLEFPVFASKLFSSEREPELRIEVLPCHVFFILLQLSFQQIFYAFAKKPDKLFWKRLEEKTFAFAGKRLEHLESRELCVFLNQRLRIIQPVRIVRFWWGNTLFVQ